MSLQDVLTKFTFEEDNPLSFNDKTTAVLTRLYNDGGPEIRDMLNNIAADDTKTYQIQYITMQAAMAGGGEVLALAKTA